MRILVTGKTGMLGSAMVELLSGKYEVTGISRMDADITDIDRIVDVVRSVDPDIVIHCAAYTDVDGCERDSGKAIRVNGYGTRNVAAGCRKTGARLLYVSTDYVFEGTAREGGYQVYDSVSPLNMYGRSKLMGEEFARLVSGFYIVRTSWLFGPGGKNFVDTMLERGGGETGLEVVNDQFGNPTYTLDLARKIGEIIKKDIFGTYHVTNTGTCSWFDFAVEVFKTAGIHHPSITPISTDKSKREAKRPFFSSLNNDHLRLNGIGLLRDWKDALREYIQAR